MAQGLSSRNGVPNQGSVTGTLAPHFAFVLGITVMKLGGEGNRGK